MNYDLNNALEQAIIALYDNDIYDEALTAIKSGLNAGMNYGTFSEIIEEILVNPESYSNDIYNFAYEIAEEHDEIPDNVKYIAFDNTIDETFMMVCNKLQAHRTDDNNMDYIISDMKGLVYDLCEHIGELREKLDS